LDLLELDDVPRVIESLADELGGLDALVNNAGTGHSAPFLELELAEWNRVIDVDLTGAFVAAQAAARRMVESGAGGRIVNITSVHEHIPKPGAAAYCAAKGGLGLMTKVMALELAEHGITVNAIAPGEISTPMTGQHETDPKSEDRPNIPLGRPGHAREIAGAVVFLCSEDASYATGASLVVDGGLVLIPAAVN
jgi:NAD(P)-dependent dehydrogenase (short-subunit alcohol dehydrogenase family)